MLLKDITSYSTLDEVVQFIRDTNKVKVKAHSENIDTLDYKEKSGNLIIDYSYQRNFIQTEKSASAYIESILLGLSIPEIQVFEDFNTGVREIIDGQQRTLSLLKYYRNEYPLTGLFELSELNKLYFKDLPVELQAIIKNFHLNIKVLSKPDNLYKYIAFERLNTGSKILTAQEIRNCTFSGPMLTAAKVASNSEAAKKVLYRMDNLRFKRDELICDTLCLMHQKHKGEFEKTTSLMKRRINRFLQESATFTPEYIEELVFELEIALDYLSTNDALLKAFDNAPSTRYSPATSYQSLLLALMQLDTSSINVKLAPLELVSAIESLSFEETRGTGKSNAISSIATRVQLITDALITPVEPLKLDPRRLFTRQDKLDLYTQEKRESGSVNCKLCNQPVHDVDLAQIDHILPWSKGGQTVLENAQLTHSTCNRLKSNKS